MVFERRSLSNQVYFGSGMIDKLPTLLGEYGRVMVIASQRWTATVEGLRLVLGDDRVAHFSKIIQHVPEDLVLEAGMVRSQHRADVLVAIGGGSAIGLSKALAMGIYVQQIAVPTTFSGSEQTNIYGISAGGIKKTGRLDQVLPGKVIYDPDLTLHLPTKIAAVSAMNAMAHLMEAFYSPLRNPITTNEAMLGMKSIKKGMQDMAENKKLTPMGNEQILFGALLAGKSLGEVTMGLHHKIAHVLGGTFGLDHASVHTALQSYILNYHWPFLPTSVQQDFVLALESDNPPDALRTLAAGAGARTDLESIGFDRKNISAAAEMIVASPYDGMVPVTKEILVKILTNAYHGYL